MNKTDDPVRIDLGSTGDLILEATGVLSRLRRSEVFPAAGDSPTKSSTERRQATFSATVSKDLLYLSSVLRRAASEAEAQYYAGRGYPDVLSEP